MKNATIGVIATLLTSSIIALASLYVQVQVMDNEIGHLKETLSSIRVMAGVNTR